jgi:formate hydrogenlyase subunit 6/NADH:ubiquinone oxidoreductase subunit I
MNNIAYSSKRKNSNYLYDNLLEFQHKTKLLKVNVEWYFNDDNILDNLDNLDDWQIEDDCFYITEFHQIAVSKSSIAGGKTVFILHLNKLLPNMNDFFKIIPETNKKSYTLLSLDKFKSEYKLVVSVNSADIKFINDIKLRKLNYCIDCNECGKVCPINSLQSNFSPIEFIKSEIIKNNYIKAPLCTGCSKCNTVCPVGISLSDYFLFYNKPNKWNEKLLNKALHTNYISKYVFKFIK